MVALAADPSTTNTAYVRTLSKSNSPSLNFDARPSLFSFSIIVPSEVPVPVVTVVLVTSVSSEVVVAPILRIVGADIVERANEGIGPTTDIRLGTSEVGDGSSSRMEMRLPTPKAETAGEMGKPVPPVRRPEREPERREPELAVWARECADGREEFEPERSWKCLEDVGAEPEDGLKCDCMECSEPCSESIG